VPRLAELLGVPELAAYEDPRSWDERRDDIKSVLAATLAPRRLADVLEVLESAGVWCAEVLTWEQLVEHDGFREAGMLLDAGEGGRALRTTRCPIRIDGEVLASPQGAPRLDEHRPAGEEVGV
jgi:crotonobetainyl-CoA:carnitine CoA-transferase CaiB-like acyl-CoA transferase